MITKNMIIQAVLRTSKDWLNDIPAKTYYEIAKFIKDKRLTNIRTNEVVDV